MKSCTFCFFIIFTGLTLTGLADAEPRAKQIKMNDKNQIILPEPKLKHGITLEEAIAKRRSCRQFKNEKVTLGEISQLLWAAQGITHPPRRFRSTPSAGALYPLEIFIVTHEGIFHYLPRAHRLNRIKSGDFRNQLKAAALNQNPIAQAPLSIIIAAEFKRTTSKYGSRGIRYCYMESGHCGQNILLEAVSLGLEAVPIGAFHDEKVKELLQPDDNLSILYIISIGHAQD